MLLAMTKRLQYIDVLRGIIMCLMVLDHARDFYFGFRPSPTDLELTTPILFLTRWLTHFCAPLFVFLAGVSAYLYLNKTEKSYGFLFRRGLLLVILELVVIRLGWTPDFFYHFTLVQVIWVLGCSMIILSLLSRLLTAKTLLILGLLGVIFHASSLEFLNQAIPSLESLWGFLFDRRMYEPIQGHRFLFTYPIIPWCSIMLCGYGLGKYASLPAKALSSHSFKVGSILVLLFIIIRGLNFGDSVPWSQKKNFVFTMISFLNCDKYPPSLVFTLMTIGPGILIMSFLLKIRKNSKFMTLLSEIGKGAFIFYILHLFLLRYTGILFAYLRHGEKAFLRPPDGTFYNPKFELWVAYLAAILCIVTIYPLVKKYRHYKKSEKAPKLLKYL